MTCLEDRLVLSACEAPQADLEGQQPEGAGDDAEQAHGDCRENPGRPLTPRCGDGHGSALEEGAEDEGGEEEGADGEGLGDAACACCGGGGGGLDVDDRLAAA